MKDLKTKWRQLLAQNRQALTTRTARVGGYSFLLGLIVLAILVAVNVLVSVLPSKFTQFDISAAQLYSLTSDTKVVVTNLDQDVKIYWITQAGKEDTVVQKLLDRYADLSDHISIEKKDPDTYPPLLSSTPMKPCRITRWWWNAAQRTAISATTRSITPI